MVLGPALFVLAYVLFTRGGGDLCDSVYQLPGGSFDVSSSGDHSRRIGAAP